MISSMMRSICKKEVEGAVFRTPERKRKVEHSKIVFVGDSDNCITGSKAKRVEEKKESAQKGKTLLHASGGNLELSECFNYCVKLEHDSEGKRTMKKDHERFNLGYNEECNRVAIEAKQVNEAHKTLGFHKSPAMSMVKQIDVLR